MDTTCVAAVKSSTELQLDESDIQALNCIWNNFQSNHINGEYMIEEFLKNSAKPLLLALQLFANCSESEEAKDFTLRVIKIACRLSMKNFYFADTLDKQTQFLAFILTKYITQLDLRCSELVESYQLFIIANELIPNIKDLYENGYYEDAAHWVVSLKLTSHFSLNDILIPLALQKRINTVQLYLDNAIEQQIPLLEQLDQLVDNKAVVSVSYQILLGEKHFKNGRTKILTKKDLIKIIMHLAKHYKIDLNSLPHLHHYKATAFMNYLCNIYETQKICGEAWAELIIDTANTNKLKAVVLRQMMPFLSLYEVLSWIKYFQLPIRMCPHNLRSYLDDYNETILYPLLSYTHESIIIEPHYKDSFLMLPISNDNILWIENKADFLMMIDFLEKAKIIAWQVEYKPIYLEDNDIALLQLATFERVYLIDCESTKFDTDIWKSLSKSIFNNGKIRKLSFALYNNLLRLKNSVPIGLNLNLSRQLDMLDLSNRLKNYQLLHFPYDTLLKFDGSLSNLLQIVCGKELDTYNEVSNWERRPLRQAQVIYAALDAYCLLIIYDKILHAMKQVNLYLDEHGEIYTNRI